MIKRLCSGTAVFTMPAGPITCAGAPQKIAYLAADNWRQQGVLDDIRVVLVLPTPGMFGVPEFAAVLEQVAARFGIEVHKSSELVEVEPHSRRAMVADSAAGTKDEITDDLMHVVPPQSAPEWIKRSPLAHPSNPAGYLEIDKNTMRHTRWPNVFARRRQQPQQRDRRRDPQAGPRRRHKPHQRDGRRRPTTGTPPA